ncbi:MAG: hypothetical protein ACQCN3_09495 [Candidatus Bathyarchaeia archaeon]|jgi:hypothetical protein
MQSSFKENNRWIIDNYDKLSERYIDEWVAVMNLSVFDHDKDLKKLVDRIKTKHLSDYKQIAVEYISNEEVETEIPDNLWE